MDAGMILGLGGLVSSLVTAFVVAWRASAERRKLYSETQQMLFNAASQIKDDALSLIEPLRAQLEAANDEIASLQKQLYARDAALAARTLEYQEKFEALEQKLAQRNREVTELKAIVDILTVQIERLGHEPAHKRK